MSAVLNIGIVSSKLEEVLLLGRFHVPSILIDIDMSLVDMGIAMRFSAGYTDENVSLIIVPYLMVITGTIKCKFKESHMIKIKDTNLTK